MIMQPKTRRSSREQVVTKIQNIYASLMEAEAFCIEVANNQVTFSPAHAPQSDYEHWQTLIVAHRKLLDKHYHFFSYASKHASAHPDLWQLVSTYAMPTRMWHYGIHSLLELLRNRLPASLEHLLAFVYFAYSSVALFYETIPELEDVWIECLGDLARFRMAIEPHDRRDEETWVRVSRHWYSKASDKAPTTGRLYHHLAILAWPDAFQQSFYYSKSLCVASPYPAAKESLLTLFQLVLSNNNQNQNLFTPLSAAFIKAQNLLFTNNDLDKFDKVASEFLGLLDTQIGKSSRKFMKQGCYISMANSIAMLGWAKHENLLMKAITPGQAGQRASDPSLWISFKKATQFSNSTSEIMLSRIGDPNVLPYIHCTLVFILWMSRYPAAIKLLEADFPYEKLKRFLNAINGSIINDTFPVPEKDHSRPLPEDFALRGLLWASSYFPETWFAQGKFDEDEKYKERPSMTAQRKERITWIAYRTITPDGKLQYDRETSEFYVLAPTQSSMSSTTQTAQQTINDECNMDGDRKR